MSRHIAVSPDGSRVYVTGDNMDWADCVDCHVGDIEGWPPRVPFAVALDASSGDVVWRIDDAEHAGTYGWRLALSPDGSRLYQVQSVLYPDWWTKAIRLVAYDTATSEQVWASQHDYPPAPAGMKDRNRQNRPVGVAVSPDGARIFVSTSHLYWRASGDPSRPILTNINFLALAWEADTGEQVWTGEHDWSSQAGCTDGLDVATGTALSPAGKRLYIVGSVVVDQAGRGKACEVGDPGNSTLGLLALDTGTGQQSWSSLYHNAGHKVEAPMFASNNPFTDIHILAGNIHVKPGQGPGDQGSQLYVSAMASESGDAWVLGLGFDGLTGRQVWQARHYPTGEPPDPILQGSALSPDGGTFYVTAVGYPNNSTVINVAYPTAEHPPIAELVAIPASGSAPLQVSFDASDTRISDQGGAITRYRFDFGDGSDPVTQTSPAVTHIYTDAGSYTATVTVADSTGAVATATVTITVQTG